MASLFSEIFQMALGGLEIAAGVMTGQPELVMMGIGSEIAGIGSIIAGDHKTGQGQTIREPIAPWRVCYGRNSIGGNAIYYNVWGQTDMFLDMVIVLASHPCELGARGPGWDERISGNFPQVLADKQRLTVNTSWVDIPSEGSNDKGPGAGGPSIAQINLAIAEALSPVVALAVLEVDVISDILGIINGFSMYGHLLGAYPGSGTTFSATIVTNDIQSIQRSADINSGVGSGVVTVTLSDANALPYLQEGDAITIRGSGSGSNETLNGTFQVNEILARRSIDNNSPDGWVTAFTYLQGGPGVVISGTAAGQVETTWNQMSNRINIEWLDGTQKQSTTDWTTFQMAKLPMDDVNGNNISNPWTNNCSLVNKTAVMLRMYFNPKQFPTGTYPSFSFRFRKEQHQRSPSWWA